MPPLLSTLATRDDGRGAGVNQPAPRDGQNQRFGVRLASYDEAAGGKAAGGKAAGPEPVAAGPPAASGQRDERDRGSQRDDAAPFAGVAPVAELVAYALASNPRIAAARSEWQAMAQRIGVAG